MTTMVTVKREKRHRRMVHKQSICDACD